jgi:hypothetical protein
VASIFQQVHTHMAMIGASRCPASILLADWPTEPDTVDYKYEYQSVCHEGIGAVRPGVLGVGSLTI